LYCNNPVKEPVKTHVSQLTKKLFETGTSHIMPNTLNAAAMRMQSEQSEGRDEK
jgi:hypothetical protein